ncbi:attachment glycoprotein [Avian metapneumovirus type D]|uniref:Attachment glycoprotein n=2 Tax=avian metapneumovirus TaxID=38525 RepID=A0A077SJW1_9MONO|nr:attachment membrane glycoprotein [Avian metapneumovirus]CDN30041.1 attachment glycoprotein [Avian metapneumovirus type D]
MGAKLYAISGASDAQLMKKTCAKLLEKVVPIIILAVLGITGTTTIALSISISIERAVLSDCTTQLRNGTTSGSLSNPTRSTTSTAVTTRDIRGLQTTRTRELKSCSNVQIAYGYLHDSSNPVLDSIGCLGLLALCESGPFCQRNYNPRDRPKCRCTLRGKDISCCKEPPTAVTTSKTTPWGTEVHPTYPTQVTPQSQPATMAHQTATANQRSSTTEPVGSQGNTTSSNPEQQTEPPPSPQHPPTTTSQDQSTETADGQEHTPTRKTPTATSNRRSPTPKRQETGRATPRNTATTQSGSSPPHSSPPGVDANMEGQCKELQAPKPNSVCKGLDIYREALPRGCDKVLPLCKTSTIMCVDAYYSKPPICFGYNQRCFCMETFGPIEFCCKS